MFCETKRNVKSWAVFNFAAILTVLCYHMWRSCLWLVDIDSKWQPPQLYQMRSYRNPTLLPWYYEACLLPYSNLCLQFILDTFCYVLLRLRLWFPQWAPGLTWLLGNVEKNEKTLWSRRKTITKLFQYRFRSGQNWGHQRSSKVKFFRNFQIVWRRFILSLLSRFNIYIKLPHYLHQNIKKKTLESSCNALSRRVLRFRIRSIV